jgi:hypothetical protein
MRTALSMLLGTLLITGCIFPSFDEMQGGQKGAIAAKGDDVTDSTGTSPPPLTSATSAAADAADAASPDATPGAKTGGVIACGTSPDGGAPVQCSIAGGKGCCTTIGGPDCQDNAALAFCHSPQGGSILRCDDKDDCSGADVCCFLAGAKEAACSPSCTGAVLCTKDNPQCPAGKACTGIVNLQAGFTSSFCQ